MIDKKDKLLQENYGKSPIARWGYLLIFHGILLMSVFGVAGCGDRDSEPVSAPTEQKIDESLTFNDITLDQVNDRGEKVWTVRSPVARYMNEQKIVRVDRPEGELFQDGTLLYKISAQKGEVHQNGEKILLQGDIVATDPNSGAVLKGQELEWLPKQDLLVVRDRLTGTHPTIDVSANEGRVQTKTNQIELLGNVVATVKDPLLQLRSEGLVWQIDQQVVASDRTVEIDRYSCNSLSDCSPTDQGTSDRGEYNLDTKMAKLENNVHLTLSQPPLTIQSDLLVWNLTAETVTSETPLNAMHREQKFTLTGDRGILDIPTEIFAITGNVRATGNEQRPFNLQANQMTWDLPQDEIQAEGDVMYRQANPPLTLSGSQAVGKLTDQTVVITGGNVVTEVVP